MAISQQQIAEARSVYERYWESYLSGDFETFMSVLHEQIHLIGTTESELFFNKTEVEAFFQATVNQVVGKIEARNRNIQVLPAGETVNVIELADMYVLIEDTWTFYSKFRVSTLLAQTPDGWKVYQQHGSLPDIRAQEGETVAPDQIKLENMQLRDAVNRRTVELAAKNRELEVEACLERVRAQAIAMAKPDDLLGICEVLFDELSNLAFPNLRNAMINIYEDDKGQFINYDYSDTMGKSITTIRYDIHPVVEHHLKLVRSTRDAFAQIIFSGKDLDDWKEFRRRNGEQDDPRLETHSALYYYFYSIGLGDIGISAFEPIGDEKREVLKRFRNVFDFAYRRYVDVTQAVASAREAQIEAALDRVRARTMAMQRSDELMETSYLLFEQLKQLGEIGEQVSIGIIDEDTGMIEMYATSHGNQWQRATRVPYSEHGVMKGIYRAWKEQKRSLVTDLSGEALASYNAWRRQLADIRYATGLTFAEDRWIIHSAFFSKGQLSFSTREPRPEAALQLLERFAGVFELTYTRFLDLTQAEAQTREAQIEAALERVRAKAMAMHKSEDLNAAVAIVFEELDKLKLGMLRCGIGILNKEKRSADVWTTSKSEQGSVVNVSGDESIDIHPLLQGAFEAFVRKETSSSYVLEGNDLTNYYRALGSTNFKLPEAEAMAADTGARKQYYYNALFATGGLFAFRDTEFTDEAKAVMHRFAAVFDLTYTRFQDLKKAEAQTREAQIEAALERVRAKAMAMRDSSDLSVTSGLVFSELHKLGITSVRCGVVVLSKESRSGSLYYASSTASNDTLVYNGAFTLAGHPSLVKQYDHWLKQEDYFVTLRNDELTAYYENLQKQNPLPFVPHDQVEQEEHGYYFYFSEGQFYVWTKERYSDEEVSVLTRFKAIFDLTFRRYLDLQKAEAQAREAQIEASLERVRSRTLAMQKSDELAETAAVLFNQLIKLGIAPNRLYICIIKNQQGAAEFWITDEDGSKVSTGFATNLLDNGSFRKMFTGWQDARVSLVIDMQGQELQEYLAHLSSLNVPFKGGLSHTRRVQTIAYFSKGFIGMASPDEQPNATTQLLERFAAVFNLTFTRFNDLQLAEAQAHQAQRDLIQLQNEKKRAEDALTELRATQTQLLQQEKLASLGQLTAGIAHEIKNPLNFVNNFSSISMELLDEAAEELKKTSPESAAGDAGQLLADVRMNLAKIIEHGTRADGIVKSMLQHSRGGSGRKEPVDLNVQIQEFVNLAFHGMRAGKNPINVDIVLDLQDSLGKVSVIAEDFSRVIINLCQNAFDAMRDKTKESPSSYLPQLTVRTRKDSGKVRVEVADNGPGIPDEIRDKILQPFFTTKKGTLGTGLGLSITHDIVKAHGGELSITGNNNGGATFVVTLPQDAQA